MSESNRCGLRSSGCLSLLVGALLLSVCADVWPQLPDAPTDEAHVKAAFVYKFTGYVDWPNGAWGSAEAPFVMGVLGSDTMLDELTQLTTGRKVHERPVVVRKMRDGESIADLQLLFVGRAQTLHAEVGKPVLVVTEADGEMPRASMINFVIVDRHVRFEIALPTVERAGLRMSSRLLGVAEKVYQGEDP